MGRPIYNGLCPFGASQPTASVVFGLSAKLQQTLLPVRLHANLSRQQGVELFLQLAAVTCRHERNEFSSHLLLGRAQHGELSLSGMCPQELC
mmetsp:Transcript_5534/g.9897  ORF Transcript_5534/g.9897 Transcript_5534/m.9897 type:complete len:92 (-) Transcript_5534:289-564(-)